ncbi:MAG: hypothetical protein K2X81_00205 [Candidatus Obscuribacterales bacterium]|nr:hypothetical protein [Candidatus Obscuribacterales bacterium]
MEDFGYARVDERKQQSGFQAEWIESLPKTAANSTDSCLSLTAIVKDNQVPVKEKTEASGKDAADALDKQLRNFADSKLTDASRDVQKFQKAVGKFCDSSDKESALDELGETYTKVTALMDLKADALFNEVKAEAARTPGRKEALDDVKRKNYEFSDKIVNLPFEESLRVEDLVAWKDGENSAQHDARVRKGLESNKPMLDAYNAIKDAEKKVEDNKGPREKQLDKLSKQVDDDGKTMKDIMEKAYLRSTLKN